jgi:formylglycine-generating enzyme required for sulfatase activity
MPVNRRSIAFILGLVVSTTSLPIVVASDTPSTELSLDREMTLQIDGGSQIEFVPIPKGEFVTGNPAPSWTLIVAIVLIGSALIVVALKTRRPLLKSHYSLKGCLIAVLALSCFVWGGLLAYSAVEANDGLSLPPKLHRIEKPFLMSKYEITQEQYTAVTGLNSSKYVGLMNPVEHVSFSDAVTFCALLGQKLGKSIRLPTEVEWEYACKGSRDEVAPHDIESYSWGDCDGPHPVGMKKPNGFGLHDMLGNVAEWCIEEPTNTDQRFRMTRGGSFAHPSKYRTATARWRFDEKTAAYGFRIVLVP